MQYRILLVFSLFSFSVFSQSLPASRSTDWTLAGLRDTTYPASIHIFSGDNTGFTDNTAALQAFIAGLTLPAVVQFEAGNYLFNSEIVLPSNIVIRGKGAGITTLTFDLSGATEGCFVASGSASTTVNITSQALKEDYIVDLASTAAINVGDFVRFIKDDQALLNDSYAYNRTGQISRVVSKTTTSITLDSPLRMDYLLSENPKIRRIVPKTNIGIECLSINRIDQVSTIADRNKVSKIKFNRVVNSWVKGVESINSNYAHFEALYCANLLVSECYFHDAFEYGTGGRAYGVMLHFATSECRIENTIFDNLRHAMILQVGANGNVFAYNSSTNARDQNAAQDEDMVCHGNYPYLNLFEGNVCEAPTVDGSHGENGPYNTFFRNRSSINSFNVTAGFSFSCFCTISNANQNFIGNEGSSSIGGSSHFIDFNSWQSNSGTLETSLAYSTKPDFLTPSEFGAIGYGYFGSTATNPAKKRYDAANYISGSCGYHVWNGTQWESSFIPDMSSDFFDIIINDGGICTISGDTEANSVVINPGGRLEVSAGVFAVSDSLYLRANISSYSQFLGDYSLPTVYELVLQTPGWHLLSSPIQSVDLTPFEDEIQINYAGNPNLPSAYIWNPTMNIAEYQPIVANSFSFSSNPINLYVSDLLVKPGKGLNADGNLPVKIQLKGMSKNGSQTNSSLGYGIAADVVGTDADGWNLIMNPYPCSIDLDVVFNSVPANYQIGAHVFNAAINGYEVRTVSSVNNGNPTTIAPSQAFYVKLDNGADLNSGFFNFTNSARTLAQSPALYNVANPWLTLTLELEGESVAKSTVYTTLLGSKTYHSATDISLFKNTNGSNWSLGIIKSSNNRQRLLNVAGFGHDSIPATIPFALFAREDGLITINPEFNHIESRFYLEDAKAGTFSPLHKAIDVHVEKGPNLNRFYIHKMPKSFSDDEIIAAITLSSYALKIAYDIELHHKGAILVSDAVGRTILHVPSFTPKDMQEWALPDLKSGVYILSIREANSWKTLKFVL